jgi:hypothetical protein
MEVKFPGAAEKRGAELEQTEKNTVKRCKAHKKTYARIDE